MLTLTPGDTKPMPAMFFSEVPRCFTKFIYEMLPL
jgi:hypothetical protein